jgi:hypothetical protein
LAGFQVTIIGRFWVTAEVLNQTSGVELAAGRFMKPRMVAQFKQAFIAAIETDKPEPGLQTDLKELRRDGKIANIQLKLAEASSKQPITLIFRLRQEQDGHWRAIQVDGMDRFLGGQAASRYRPQQ